tara:strand:- start:189 stop:1646 length:1458 start_codon:yes stop_codon:yes gene_type:complete
VFIYLNNLNVYNLFSKKIIFMENINFKDLINLIKTGDISPVELTEYYLDRISVYNTDLNAFITILAEEAMKEAKVAEKEISNGHYRGPLHGIPYAAKDIINTANIRTTNGSKKYDNFYPEKDAFCIQKMKDAGAILLGKTNTHQYAAASTTINVHYGTTKNPHDKRKIAGGSSGGSASAISANLVPIALGTDTGGSIRTPASLCGIVGLKPTYGAISLNGVFPNSPSIDHVGPMGESVFSTAMAFKTLKDYDKTDPRSIINNYFNSDNMLDNIDGFRVALCPELYENQELDNEIEKSFTHAVGLLKELGVKVSYVKYNDIKTLQNLFYNIAGPEFTRVHRQQYNEDPNSFDPDVRKRMDWSVKVKIDDYLRGLEDKVRIMRDIEEKIENFDALITPATPFTAPLIDDLQAIINGKKYDYTVNIHRKFFSPFNVTGLPALVLPIGKDKSRMPIAMQIVGKKWCEHTILQIAYNIEKNILYNSNIKL